MSDPIDLDHLRQWVGREQVGMQRLAPFPAQALAGLLDRDAGPTEGEPLPLPWHWLYFLDAPCRSAMGPDGHPVRGGFLPPVPLPRRMWASGQVDVAAPLVLDAPARKVSVIDSVELKAGKTGPLVFVALRHALYQADRLCLRETQHLVYRAAPITHAPLPPGERAAVDAQWRQVVQPDPTLLFRFSALTYNGHRIHYDRDYAVQQERYPALVVQGPLLATLLLEALHRERPQAVIQAFSFQALRPAFDADALVLCGRIEGAQAQLWTEDPHGHVGMRATAVLA